jgi:uncharacterized protein (DUF58 family)
MRNEIRPAMTGRFVDPVVLARVGNLELVARSVVDGFINGMHRSPYFGASVDFAEHRGYTPGDDIRRVDWKLFGRTDRFYIKEYEATPTQLRRAARRVEVDGLRQPRHHQARLRADPRGLSSPTWCTGSAIASASRVRRGHRRVRAAVGQAHGHDAAHPRPPEAGAPGQLAPPMKKLAEHFGRRGLLVLVSDFYEDPQAVLEAVSPLRFRGHDMIVFHVLDPAEIEFNYDQASRSRTSRAASRSPWCPRRWRSSTARSFASTATRCARSSRNCVSTTS